MAGIRYLGYGHTHSEPAAVGSRVETVRLGERWRESLWERRGGVEGGRGGKREGGREGGRERGRESVEMQILYMYIYIHVQYLTSFSYINIYR